MAKDKEMAVKEEMGLAPTVVPGTATGFEGQEKDEGFVPRLKLLQALSKAVVDGAGKAGDWQNDLSEDIYDKELDVVPLAIGNSAVYFGPDQELVCKSEDGFVNREGIECKACPHKCYHKGWANNERPKCNTVKEYVVVFKETLFSPNPTLLVVSFMGGSSKVGRKWAPMAYSKHSTIYACSYKLTAEKDSKGRNFTPKIKLSNYLSQEEYNVAAKLAGHFKDFKMEEVQDVKVDEEKDDFNPEVCSNI